MWHREGQDVRAAITCIRSRLDEVSFQQKGLDMSKNPDLLLHQTRESQERRQHPPSRACHLLLFAQVRLHLQLQSNERRFVVRLPSKRGRDLVKLGPAPLQGVLRVFGETRTARQPRSQQDHQESAQRHPRRFVHGPSRLSVPS